MAVTITLSLVSHTNVGKTTLARTLLGADVGEVRDEEHVTEFADGHELVEAPNPEGGSDRLRLWDTPGFGDSARLAARLAGRGNPLGWFLAEVWDRWRDRPFWASQQALRHVQAESDVLLYLVNAADTPSMQGYVAAEMQILAWVGKPVIVLLNQLGAPREAALEAAEVAAWRDALVRWPLVRQVLPLDAFARCWVHERTLLDAVQAVLEGQKAAAMARLATAWTAQREAVFEASIEVLAQGLARAALARVVIEEPTGRGLVGQALRQIGHALRGGEEADTAATRARAALAEQLAAEARDSTAALLKLHRLSGRAPAERVEQILARVAGQFALSAKVPEGKSALVGGVVTGALAGLKADIATGGLTLGGGMLVGAVLGALGGAGVARGINLVRGTEQAALSLNDEALHTLAEQSLLRYLAVAHFGRGRGDWVEGEAPAHWPQVVHEALAPERAALAAAWAGRAGAPDTITITVQPALADAARRVLHALYPAAGRIANHPH